MYTLKTGNKITSFTDLQAWREAHQLALMVYQLTDKFPDKEIYSLTSQLRRAVISITSNIAEGFSRQGKKEKIQFYYTAKGSLTEIQSQIIPARDLGYIKQEDFKYLADKTVIVSKLIFGLIKSIRNN